MNSINTGGNASGALLFKREYSLPPRDYQQTADKARNTASSGRRMLSKPAVNNLMSGQPELVLAVGSEGGTGMDSMQDL